MIPDIPAAIPVERWRDSLVPTGVYPRTCCKINTVRYVTVDESKRASRFLGISLRIYILFGLHKLLTKAAVTIVMAYASIILNPVQMGHFLFNYSYLFIKFTRSAYVCFFNTSSEGICCEFGADTASYLK